MTLTLGYKTRCAQVKAMGRWWWRKYLFGLNRNRSFQSCSWSLEGRQSDSEPAATPLSHQGSSLRAVLARCGWLPR